jgi:hypothetical protein
MLPTGLHKLYAGHPPAAAAVPDAWEAIVAQCMVTEAVTPDPADPYGTIGKLMDYAAEPPPPVVVDEGMVSRAYAAWVEIIRRPDGQSNRSAMRAALAAALTKQEE